MVWPQSFDNIAAYFRRAFSSATPERARRLSRVLELRSAAEAKNPLFARVSGAFTLLMAASVMVLHLAPMLAYAGSVLCMSLQLAVSYGDFHPVIERRAARLARRTWYSVLSPAVYVCAILWAYAAVELSLIPQVRFTVILLFAAAALMLVVAARIADAAARLLGNDPEVEDVVDERVRHCRANAIGISAGLPINLFAGLVLGQLPDTVQYQFLPATLAFAWAAATYVALMIPVRKPLALP
jgi:hypothetical protein